MTIFDIVQRALIVHQFLLIAAGIGLTLTTVACALLLVRGLSWTLYRCALDGIELYRRWQTARADTTRRIVGDKFIEDSRRIKLAVWQRQARNQITQQRTALQLGSAAMWQAGVFDIEIEEAANGPQKT